MTVDRSGWVRKYRWELTRPDQEREDWSAYDGDLCIGRVSRDRAGHFPGRFMWSGGCSCWHGFIRPMPHSGRTEEAWVAAKSVEDWYDEGVARTGPKPAWVSDVVAALAARGKKFGW